MNSRFSAICKYKDEFFRLNNPNKSNPDILKLVADQNRLFDELPKDSGSIEVWISLDPTTRQTLESVSRYIEKQQREIANYPEKSGFTPLMKCVSRKMKLGEFPSALLDSYEKEAMALIEKGAKVDEQDVHGRTALMHAIIGEHMFYEGGLRKGRERTINFLLRAGANALIKDNYGKTALDYARQYIDEPNHPAISLLETAMSQQITRDEMAKSAFGQGSNTANMLKK